MMPFTTRAPLREQTSASQGYPRDLTKECMTSHPRKFFKKSTFLFFFFTYLSFYLFIVINQERLMSLFIYFFIHSFIGILMLVLILSGNCSARLAMTVFA